MKLTDDLQTAHAWGTANNFRSSENQTAASAAAAFFEEPEVLLELSFYAVNKDSNEKTLGTNLKYNKADKNSSGVEDHSGRLTRRLVNAKSTMEVQAVLAGAYKNLGDALQAAAGGDEKAMEVVRRLNKLIRRANRKVRDLNKEEDIRQRQKKAEKKELEQLKRELEEELKRKIAERKQRERKYLRDVNPPNKKPVHPIAVPSAAALQARMQAYARIAALTPPAASISTPSETGASTSAAGETTADIEE